MLPFQAPSVAPSLPTPAVTRASGLAPGPRWVRPPWFSKPVSVGSPSPGSVSPASSPTARDGPAVGGEVEQAEAGVLLALGEERDAEQLVAGADGEDDGARSTARCRPPSALRRSAASACGPSSPPPSR